MQRLGACVPHDANDLGVERRRADAPADRIPSAEVRADSGLVHDRHSLTVRGGLHELHPPRIPTLVLDGIETAEGHLRPPHGFRSRYASTQVLLDLLIEVQSQLLVEFT